MQPEHCLKLEGWRGPPQINKTKQYEIVLPFKVSNFIHFIRLWKQSELVNQFFLGI